jgi:putative transposase
MGVAKHPQHNHKRRDATMQERSKPEREDRESPDTLTTLIRSGARELIAQALEMEVAELLASYAEQRDEHDRAVVVRNGHHPTRAIQTGIGPVEVVPLCWTGLRPS